MKIISSKAHGVLNYLVGFILIISPWLFGFAAEGAETAISVILGIGAILYSIVTNYELGFFKIIPFKVHLIINTLSGILLASSPWLFGFADNIHLPHLVFGVLEILVVILSKTIPSSAYKKASA